MTDNKKGYKKTKLGWIPEDWEIVNLKNIAKVGDIDHYMPVSKKEGIPYVMTGNFIGYNDIDYKNSKKISIEDYLNLSEKIKPEYNDILIARYASIGTVRLVKRKEPFLISYSCAIIKPKKLVNSCYLFNWLQSNLFKSFLNLEINSNTQKNIGISSLNNSLVIFPQKLQEQEKIAEILSTWDEGIEILEKLIEQKELSKKSIIQKLFQEKVSWKLIRFDKIFKDFCQKNCPNEILLSATQENGVIPRDMLNGKVMSPEGSLENYKLIEEGDFVISLRSFQGGLEYSKYRGILSPAYTVLKNIIDIDKDFYRYFFKSYKFIEKYLSISVIGIRDGKQISYSDLSSVKIPYPPLNEQEKIGKILNCYDEEIRLLNIKLEKLKQQKKGLMQKLLTGQIRVKI